ncbi:hypothetical protein FSP39_025052 [Pinctada imbricata]|uniref:Ionotropic glutamate receptor C-terminal domain-containing protein n=1 Tax=Pinctada imbricata TaxID=66713 RepID=A0AA88XUM5_PINIB|nr:hypothetical protein FSP39_025052 [Pinctada imbricata]
MVGMVMRGEADIGVAPFTITATRDEVVDFLTPFQEEGVGIIMKKPDPNANRMFKMFLPFQYSVWVAIVATMIFIGFLQYIVHRLSPYNMVRLRLVDALWMSFGAYVGQGGEYNPKFPSGRIILGIWWVFTIVVLALYTANLAAFLTITLAKTPIKNIAELSAQTEYKPLVKEGTNLISLFKNADSGTYAKIWSMMSDMPVVKTTDEAYDMVLSEPYAFMTDVSQLEYRALTDCQNVDIAEETFNKAGLSFLVRENAPFLEAFNAHMIRMLEAGLIAKYRSNWWPSNSACNEASYTTTANSLDLDSIAGLYFVYCGMIALSLVVLFIEIILRKYYYKIKEFLCRRRRVNSSSTLELTQENENSEKT